VTPAEERARTLRRIRDSLQELVADGIDYLPRPARVRAVAAAAAPMSAPTPVPPKPGFRPRVAPLAEKVVLSDAAGERAPLLAAVRAEIGDCRRCGLCEKRKEIVFGEGAADARVVFVGEGPGEEEDKSGRPFVGRAGELLTKMIEAVGWRREDVYICNIVKCRPPGNRTPLADEVATCRPFLDGQIDAVRPKVIVALGKPATSLLLGRDVSITRVRGIWQDYRGYAVMPTFHPAFLLRQYTAENRRLVWEDLKAALARARELGGRIPDLG